MCTSTFGGLVRSQANPRGGSVVWLKLDGVRRRCRVQVVAICVSAVSDVLAGLDVLQVVIAVVEFGRCGLKAIVCTAASRSSDPCALFATIRHLHVVDAG